MGQLRGQQEADRARGTRYGDEADWYFQQLLNSPGLTPEERAGILQAQRSQLQFNDGDAANSYLTDAEQAQIIGDPQGWAQGYAERYNNQNTAFQEGAGNVRTVRGQGADAMRGANTRSSEALAGILGQMDGRLQDAAGREGLGMTGGFVDRLTGAASGGRDAGRGLVGSTRANLDGVDANMAMRPEAYQKISNVDEAAIEGAAGRAAGAQTQRLIDQVTRKAMSTGGGNPLVLANALGELADMGVLRAGQARADSRVMAGREGRNAMATAEDMRLGTEGRRAALRSGNELALLGEGMQNEGRGAAQLMQALQAGEGMRLDSERDIADRFMRAGQATGAASLDAANAQAGRELGAETTIAGRALDNESGLMDRYQSMLERANEYYTGNSRDAEAANAARQATVALNRQGTARYNQGARFDQGMAVADSAARGWGAISDARRQDETAGRNYLTGQNQFYSGQAQRGMGQQIDAFGTGAGAMNTAQGQANQAAAQPKWWERAIQMGVGVAGALTGTGGGGGLLSSLGSLGGGAGKAAGSAAPSPGGFVRTMDFSGRAPRMFGQGGVVNEPLTAILGEEGPEMVIPMQPQRQAIPQVSMNTLDRILPRLGAMAGGNESGMFERIRRQKLMAQQGPRMPLGVLG